ncbi:MAG: hypothetical protein ONB24_04995 [candidate division KSB1 bacterium]|nr:hypothetical protein [candidate division KSB1 bacterium]
MKTKLLFLPLLFFGFQCSKNIVSECRECVETPSGTRITFSAIQQTIFTPQCVSCHGGSYPAAGLNLEAGKAYEALVNVPSASSPQKRVVPFNSAESYLVWVLDGKQAPLMPPSGRLAQAQIDSVIAWIDRGAENN